MKRRNFVKLFTLSSLSVFALKNVMGSDYKTKKVPKHTDKKPGANVFAHSLDDQFHLQA